MKEQYIFYGAGRYAESLLSWWLLKGIEPVCFADADKSKHYNTLSACRAGDTADACNKKTAEFQILPLHEAMERYPQARILITVLPESYDFMYSYLIKEGVPPDRIGASPQHCELLGHHLFVDGVMLSTCCAWGYSTDFGLKSHIGDNIRQYYKACYKLRDDLNQGKLTSCSGCYMLKPGRSNEDLLVNSVNLSTGIPGGESCNIKCSYCEYKKEKNLVFKENVLEMLRYLASETSIRNITYAAGEITVSSYCNDICSLWKEKEWTGTVATNAVIYSDGIAHLMKKGLAGIIVSQDCGTEETFVKIKGVNCYERVLQNLRNYAATGGLVELKYIVLDRVNCGHKDIDNFVLFAKEIGANVIISHNTIKSLSGITDEENMAAKRLLTQCRDNNIDVHMHHFFNMSGMNDISFPLKSKYI